MRYECNACNSRFHDTDQNRSQQRNGECPSCGYEDIQEDPPLVCPVLSIGREEPQFCIHEVCASWNDYFQKCNMAIPGFLNAREEERIKQEESKIKAYAEECAGRYQ